MPWLTTTQLAAKLNVKPQHVHRLKQAGRLPFTKVGRLIRYDLEKVQQSLAAAE